MKICTRCGLEKGVTEFYKRAGTDKPRTYCKKCDNERSSKNYHSSEEVRTLHRLASRKHVLKKYGLTLESYMAMFDDQKGLCVICDKVVASVSQNRYLTACVDHCHESGKVRGLLCWDCNVGLGKFYDKPELLVRAAQYLIKHS